MIQDIAPHKLDNQFQEGQSPSADSLLFVIQKNRILLKEHEDTICLPEYGLLHTACHYLFKLDETACYLCTEELKEIPEGYRFYEIRKLRNKMSKPRHLIFGIYTAAQIFRWMNDNRFCGTCGSKTVPAANERAIDCPSCGRRIYPRIQPAVIVGVTNGDQILMTKYADRELPFYALIAGFTEIGETLEETVHREVMEEVGLKVKNLRYYKSQPWAMADDLLAGFYCDVDGDSQISLDTNELKEGVWMKREEIIGQPDDFSLTNEMMMVFREGNEPH